MIRFVTGIITNYRQILSNDTLNTCRFPIKQMSILQPHEGLELGFGVVVPVLRFWEGRTIFKNLSNLSH